MAKKITSATKLVIPCRISFANIFEPKSINGSEAKYSVSCLIPKDDKKTLLAIHKAVEAAKEDGKVRKWGGKLPPNLKLPLRDGDIDRPDDENYQEHFFLNATSKDAPQVVDRHVQPVVDPMMVYSGCFCNVSVNFYPFNANYKDYFDKRIHLIEVKNFGRAIDPAKDIAAFFEVKKIAAEIKPNVIHLHSSKAGAIGRMAFNGKIPMFYTPHGYSFLMERGI